MAPLSTISLAVPAWAWELGDPGRPRPTAVARMDLVLALVERNIAEGGGPFAAAVFDADGHLVAPGVNRVVPDSAPIAHAEIVAIAAAGQRLGSWDLRSRGRFELVTSTEPCAMCLGAVPWSGVSALVIGAREGDARAVGFDEGHKPPHWEVALGQRGIEVVRDVERDRAAELLHRYASTGGAIYNGAGGTGDGRAGPGRGEEGDR
jgi:tRNA(Arg) A34 adenosine deaminase TadA